MFHVEQKLSSEIIDLLMKGDLHPRGLAEKLGTNHMTVLRKLRDLQKENVLDCRTEGKNKIFFVKRSIEARNAAMITEILKQSRIISRYPVLRGISKSVQEMPEVSLAILYGSYAKGLAVKGSDIDLYIETLNADVKKQLEQRHSSLSVKTGMFDPSDPLIREIIKDHVIIRGVEEYFEKTEFLTKAA